MISDFGTSEEMLRGKRERTGHTGTMESVILSSNLSELTA